MVTGPLTAEAALLLIDANEGVGRSKLNAGMVICLNLLGIRQIAVLVNKWI